MTGATRERSWHRPVLLETSELRDAKKFAADQQSALRRAEAIGYVDGFSDRHSVDRKFRFGLEWIAWLKGWRAGQAELRRQRARANELILKVNP